MGIVQRQPQSVTGSLQSPVRCDYRPYWSVGVIWLSQIPFQEFLRGFSDLRLEEVYVSDHVGRNSLLAHLGQQFLAAPEIRFAHQHAVSDHVWRNSLLAHLDRK